MSDFSASSAKDSKRINSQVAHHTFKKKEKIMLSSKSRKLTLGVSTALAMMYSPAHAQTISFGVAANFSSTLNTLLADFTDYAATTWSVDYSSFNVTVDSTGNLKTAIINGGTSGPYDIFLSADQATPDFIYANYASLRDGADFPYAYGSLELYSGPHNLVNISAGMPGTLTQNFVLADPTKAPYGAAAAKVLSEIYPTTFPSGTTYPSGYAKIQPNINATYQAVQNGTYGYGFVAKSGICSKTTPTGAENYPTGTYHHEYLYSDTTYGYSQIKQYGMKIAISGRSTGAETELGRFVSYLTGSGTTRGTDIILKSCYILP
jgi:molybdate transport system substrate-binding protein